jgi:hypothetical protein
MVRLEWARARPACYFTSAHRLDRRCTKNRANLLTTNIFACECPVVTRCFMLRHLSKVTVCRMTAQKGKNRGASKHVRPARDAKTPHRQPLTPGSTRDGFGGNALGVARAPSGTGRGSERRGICGARSTGLAFMDSPGRPVSPLRSSALGDIAISRFTTCATVKLSSSASSHREKRNSFVSRTDRSR